MRDQGSFGMSVFLEGSERTEVVWLGLLIGAVGVPGYGRFTLADWMHESPE